MKKPWLRLYRSVLQSKKIQTLPATTFRWWINLILMSDCETGKIPPTEEVAWQMRVTPQAAQLRLRELADARLLDVDLEGFTVHDWREWQFDSDVSTSRVKQFRERRRNVSETFHETARNAPGNVIEQSRADNIEPPIVPQPAAAAPSGAGCVSLSLFGELPSDQPDVVIPPGNGTGARAALLADYAARIYAAHPADRRTLSREKLTKRLGEITKGVGWKELDARLGAIEQRHSGWCGSRKWQDGYAPSLSTHFGPSGRYEVEPPSVGPARNGDAAAELMAAEADAAAAMLAAEAGAEAFAAARWKSMADDEKAARRAAKRQALQREARWARLPAAAQSREVDLLIMGDLRRG